MKSARRVGPSDYFRLIYNALRDCSGDRRRTLTPIARRDLFLTALTRD